MSTDRAYEDGLELLMFAAKANDLAGQVRSLADSGLCVFEIDWLATHRATDGITVYKLAQGYQLLLDKARASNPEFIASPLIPHDIPLTTATGS